MYSSVTQREQFCKATFSSDHSSDGDISLNFKFVTVLTPALLERAILTDDLIESAIFRGIFRSKMDSTCESKIYYLDPATCEENLSKALKPDSGFL